jgi:hypothetical protein
MLPTSRTLSRPSSPVRRKWMTYLDLLADPLYPLQRSIASSRPSSSRPTPSPRGQATALPSRLPLRPMTEDRTRAGSAAKEQTRRLFSSPSRVLLPRFCSVRLAAPLRWSWVGVEGGGHVEEAEGSRVIFFLTFLHCVLSSAHVLSRFCRREVSQGSRGCEEALRTDKRELCEDAEPTTARLRLGLQPQASASGAERVDSGFAKTCFRDA